MELRHMNLIVGTAGGTAGKESKTYKVSLPSVWVHQMGLDADFKRLELCFDGDKITIRRQQSVKEFATNQLGKGHTIYALDYYNATELCTEIYADFTEKMLRVENHTDNMVKTAFGRNETPNWDDFLLFLEERCVPRERAGIREYLETIGLDEYAPFEIIQKTAGKMAEDQQWIKVRKL